MTIIKVRGGGTVNLAHAHGGLGIRPGPGGTYELVAYSDELRRDDYASWIIAAGGDRDSLELHMELLESTHDPYGYLRKAREGLTRRQERARANVAASHAAELEHLGLA